METDLRAASSERLAGRPLRLLVVTSGPPVKRLPELFLMLLDEGIELVFSGTEALPPEVAARASTKELGLERTESEAGAVELFRAAADLVRFLAPGLEHARWPRRRALRRLLLRAGVPSSRAAARQWADVGLPAEVCGRLRESFRELERVLPPESRLEEEIGGLGVDAVLIVTRCILGGFEPDVVKAARRLDLPTVMLVWSWDNLASKATLNEHPDLLLVWNDIQVREATEEHGVPAERVVALGAPNFDRFFEELGEAAAPERERATILYLGSSPKVAPHESAIFERWLAAFRASGDELLRGAEVVVRPHPAAIKKWAGWEPPEGVRFVEPDEKVEPAKLSRLLREAD